MSTSSDKTPQPKPVEIGSSVSQNIGGLIFFAVVFFAVGGYFLWFNPFKTPHTLNERWWLLVFPAGGILAMATAIYRSMRSAKFGRVTLTLDSVGVVGTKLVGTVRIGANIQPGTTFHVELLCHRQYMDNRQSSRVEHPCREEMTVTETTNTGGRCEFPISFHIPIDAVASCEIDTQDFVRWFVKVNSAQPGVDFRAEFLVPVKLH